VHNKKMKTVAGRYLRSQTGLPLITCLVIAKAMLFRGDNCSPDWPRVDKALDPVGGRTYDYDDWGPQVGVVIPGPKGEYHSDFYSLDGEAYSWYQARQRAEVERQRGLATKKALQGVFAG